MSAVRSAVYSVVALDPGVICDRAFAMTAIERIRTMYQAGDTPVLVILVEGERPAPIDLARFVNGLSARDVPATLVTSAQMEAMTAAGALSTVPVIIPDVPDRRGDAYVIALAAAFDCLGSFWTTASCVMSADPARVEDASVVEHASFVELMELAKGGQDVVGVEAVQLAWSTNTKFKIVNLESGRWTSVTHDTYTKRVKPVASIAVRGGLALIEARIPSAKSDDMWTASSDVLERLAKNSVRIEQMQILPDGLRLACDRANVARTSIHFIACGFTPVVVENCAKICIVGSAMSSASGVLHAIMETLEESGVRPLQISDSNVTASFIVNEKDAVAAERAMHKIFTMRERVTVDKRIAFDATTRVVRVPDRSEKLGTRQAKLLNLLLENAGKIVDIETAARHLFGEATPAAIAALRVHVHNLRKKIEDDPVDPQYILTIPNRGYTFARQWSATS